MIVGVFNNARVLYGGIDLSGDLNQVQLNYGAEVKDRSTFGVGTRSSIGGLHTVGATGTGFMDYTSTGVDTDLLYGLVASDNQPCAIFAAAVIEGSTSTGSGYAFKGVLKSFVPGGKVGELFGFTWSVESEGITA